MPGLTARRALLAVLLALAVACGGPSREAGVPIESEADAVPAPTGRYVFYLHGRLIEMTGETRPTHPEYGLYDYPAILEALSEDGATLISEMRWVDTDAAAYAAEVARRVELLIEGGVAPRDIAIVGFSKGGWIALKTSVLLARSDLRYVFLGTCDEGNAGVIDWLDGEVRGDVLAIFESTDTLAGSCATLFERTKTGLSWSEIELDTGLGHGAFYRPRSEWLTPTLEWLARR